MPLLEQLTHQLQADLSIWPITSSSRAGKHIPFQKLLLTASARLPPQLPPPRLDDAAAVPLGVS